MEELTSIFRNLNWSYLSDLCVQAIPALLCIMVHEICHGAAAYALGDHTAATQGRLSLNPLHHVDWFGLAMLLFFHIGWAKPVSVDIRNFRKPKRDMAITALAGPLSNFLLAALAMVLFGALYTPLCQSKTGGTVLDILNHISYLSISLGLFNLIPFPPLDGSKILFSFLPDPAYRKLMIWEHYGMFALIILILAMNRLFSVSPVTAASKAVYQLFFQIAVFFHSLTR